MDVCRLCLQSGGQSVPNSQEVLEILKGSLPYVNLCLKYSYLQLCDICLTSVDTVINLDKTIKSTNGKIEAYIEKSKVDKINLATLLETNNGMGKDFSNICRICLKVISAPQIFLYEHETNILRHDLILSMFKYCNVMLNCDLSEKPLMCLDCWESLQICYSFKKNYLETDKKIRAYFTLFKISKKSMTDDVLDKMSRYFAEQTDGVFTDLEIMIKNGIFYGDNVDNKGYSLRKRLKKEYAETPPSLKNMEEKKVNIKKEYNNGTISRRGRYVFTAEDDEFLLKIYLEVTSVEKGLITKPWKEIQDRWLKKFPSNPLKIDVIQRRLSIILKRKPNAGISKECPPKKKSAVKKVLVDNKIVNIFGESSLGDPNSDSDDSFVDEEEEEKEDCSNQLYIYPQEKTVMDISIFKTTTSPAIVTPVSFMPNIKSEPLSDNEEVYIIEPKVEPIDCPPSETESDTESLPIPMLERMDLPPMDLPPMDLKIEDIFSLDVKRETLNMVTNNGDIDPNVVVEDYKTCKRITVKNQEYHETLYKCSKCNFETKYQYSADRHSNWHTNPNKKGFECYRCSFVTSKYFLLKHHLATKHEENDKDEDDDDIPVLVPFTTIY